MVAASHEAVNKDFRLADTVLYYTGCTSKGWQIHCQTAFASANEALRLRRGGQ